MSILSETSRPKATASIERLPSYTLTRENESIISKIFSELATTEAGGELVLDRAKFLDLFPMPPQACDAIFRGFCGHDRQAINRVRFLAGVQALVAGGTADSVRLLFGDGDALSRDVLESVLDDILEGFYQIVFHRAFADGSPLPASIIIRLRERVRKIVDDIMAQCDNSSKAKDQVSLADLISFVILHKGMQEMISLICRNVGSFPGFKAKDDFNISSYRMILQQMIESSRNKDATLDALRSCACVLGLRSPDSKPFMVFEGLRDERSSSTSSTESSCFVDPLRMLSSRSYEPLLSPQDIFKSIADDRSEATHLTTNADNLISPAGRYPGLFKVCQNCEMEVDVRFCTECGMPLKRRGLYLGCEQCSTGGIIRLRYNFCARCGIQNLRDHRMNLIPSAESDRVSDHSLKRSSRRKKGICGFVAGDLQEWFYVYDAVTEQWNAYWALVAGQFLLLFRRIEAAHPFRILSLQGRRLGIDEYHGEHDEYVIEISPSADDQDDGCLIITTDKQVGNNWLHQMRQGTRRRAVEDYYAVGESVFKLDEMLERCICRHKLSKEKFLITILNKSAFNQQEIQKLRSEIAVFKLLRHPALISIKDVFESEQQFCVVVPQLSGGYLINSLIRKGHFEEPAVRLVIYSIVNALVRIHRAGLDLINIRPECLIVTPYAQHLVQIAHLDMNKFLPPNEVLRRGLPKRLLSYRAPEVMHSEGPTWVWGAPADMWALGILMFELLTGELPFLPMPDDFSDVSKVIEDKFASDKVWDNVSSEGKSVIQALLSPDRDERPSADVLLDNAWFSVRL